MTEQYNTEEQPEKAILISVDTEQGALTAEQSLQELRLLAKTANIQTVCMTIQKREQFHPLFYVGTGKINEIKTLIDETEATVLIADDELSPKQIRNMSDELDIKVIDRTVLILDIFASRALSVEGKIQVELAQQKYRLSRLSGLGVSLSRQGGGIGTRGPGEKKLETDRRVIQEQVKRLEDSLASIETHRELLHKSSAKDNIPFVSMVGYTNAGKSTLLNTVSGSSVLAEDKLFATLDTTTRRVKLPNGSHIQFTDTVGFINKLPHGLIKAFRATLNELSYADVIVMVVDFSDENYKNQIDVVMYVLEEINCADKPLITVYNKIDKACETFPILSDDNRSVYISAKNNEGIDALLGKIEDVLKSLRFSVTFLLPYSEGKLVNYVHGKSEIVSEAHEEDGVRITAFVNEEVLGSLREYVV